ncbi:MAG: adenylate/guanylate cyclase domain-containing protein [Bacteroidetes bacterium]|nr:adenylate/guanylate cyclase domain-containing protein [Fibrella sp.]
MISLYNQQKQAVTSFKQEFETETLRRERQRSGVLAILFAAGFLFYGAVIQHLMYTGMVPGYQNVPLQIALYMGGMMAYEFVGWCSLRALAKRMLAIPYVSKFGNATFEITALTLALYLISRPFDHPILVLLSPLTYLYFIFITLSTLRLSVMVSLWTGGLAAVEFFGLSYFLMETSPAPVSELTVYLTQTVPYLIKAVIILLTGVGAAYVAQQIRQSIQLSIERMETSDQIRTLFGQQVSPEVVQAILDQHGTMEASHRKVAVLFLDIRDFTQYADTHPADEVVAYQSTFFDLVATVVQQHGGIVNQFLGDGCMITFGAPLPLDNPAEQAVAAGMAILDAIAEANRANRLPFTTIGIGIQTGDAVVGNIGTEIRQQYNITGTVVIQASRIEQLNKECSSQMLVGQDVLDELPAVPTGTKRVGAIHLKGIAEDVVVWQLA